MRLGPIRFPVKEFKSSGVFHPFATSKAGTGGALVSRLALKLLHQKFNDGRGENQTFTRKALLAKLLRGPRLSLCAERMLRGGQCDCVSRGMQTRLRRQEQPSRALRWCVRDLNTYGGTHAGFFNFQLILAGNQVHELVVAAAIARRRAPVGGRQVGYRNNSLRNRRAGSIRNASYNRTVKRLCGR